MTNTILTDYPALVGAVQLIADRLETKDNGRQWMNKQQATSTSLCKFGQAGVPKVG